MKWLGATARNAADQNNADGSNEAEHPAQGIVLTSVPADSQAAEAGLDEGDVIREVNRHPVKNIGDLKKYSNEIDLKKGVVFDVVREGHSFYLTYKRLQ